MTALRPDHGLDTGRLPLDRVIEAAVAVGVVLLVIIGFVTSYETLRSLAATDGGFPHWLAPAVPLSFDLGIIVLSLKIVAAARQGRHALALRALVAVLSVSSVAANSAASTGAAGRLLHAVPPAMFVICFESLVSGARRATHTARRSTKAMLWLLAPTAAVRSCRRQVLAAIEPPLPKPRQAARQPARSVRAATPQLSARLSDESRLQQVREAIARTPGMSAPQLRELLSRDGQHVSVRTAQRLKARVTSS